MNDIELSLPLIALSNNSGSAKWRWILCRKKSTSVFAIVTPSDKIFKVYSFRQRTQPFSIPCRNIFLAFERLPFLRNDSPFTKNVDSGNSSSATVPVPRSAAAAAATAVVVVVVADAVEAATDAVDVAVAVAVATGALLRFAFDFFPMMITI